MALPSVQFAYAEAAPDESVVSFKYLHYQDSQIGDGDNSISGASSAGSSSRMGVNAYSVKAVVPVAGVWSLGTSFTSDSVSGASPMYHSSGLTKMTDLRRAIDVELTRYFSSGTLSFGSGYSKESDYLSRTFSLQGSLSTDDKNSTFTLGGSMNRDDINPVIPDIPNTKKRSTLVFSALQGFYQRGILFSSILGTLTGTVIFRIPIRSMIIDQQNAIIQRFSLAGTIILTGLTTRRGFRIAIIQILSVLEHIHLKVNMFSLSSMAGQWPLYFGSTANVKLTFMLLSVLLKKQTLRNQLLLPLVPFIIQRTSACQLSVQSRWD